MNAAPSTNLFAQALHNKPVALPESEDPGDVKMQAASATATKPRVSTRSYMTEPVYLRQLADLWGVPRVAKEVGYDDQTIYTALRNDEVRETTEKLARFLLLAEQVTEAKPIVVIAKIPAEKLTLFVGLSESLGVKLTDLVV